MANVKLYAIIFMVMMAMTRVMAEEETIPKVTANEMTIAAEAAASSLKSSAGEAAEGAKSWADWATSGFRGSAPSGKDLENTPAPASD